MNLPPLQIIQSGILPYQSAWELQKELAGLRQQNSIPDTLLLMQHPPVITLGKSAHAENLLLNRVQLEARGIEVLESDRGGDITYHAPGQCVGYPILHLRRPPNQPDVHAYMRMLEEILIQTLHCYGIEAGRFTGYTGVWTSVGSEYRKIAAMGVRISRSVTMHGFALNVNTNLQGFEYIVPCGIQGYGVTSMQQILKQTLSLTEVEGQIANKFAHISGHSLVYPAAFS